MWKGDRIIKNSICNSKTVKTVILFYYGVWLHQLHPLSDSNFNKNKIYVISYVYSNIYITLR